MGVENVYWRVKEIEKEEARLIPLEWHKLIAAV
jgi:hypothetical protein